MKLKKIIFQESNINRLGEIEDAMLNQMEIECSSNITMSCTIEKDITNGKLIVKTMDMDLYEIN